jgi:plastocyanin
VASRIVRLFLVVAVAIGTTSLALPAGAASQSFAVGVDGAPPTGEPWAFLRFFPGASLRVHAGDVLDFEWGGTDTPHTATLVPDGDPAAWRADNQGQGGDFQDPIPESAIGGDDGDLIENPTVVVPTDPACGTQATPCSFDGTSVVSSGFRFSDPSAQPSFFASVDAPVGAYSFLCLLHPGMEDVLKVVPDATTIPTPAEVATKAAKQLTKAINVDGAAAELQSQTIAVGTSRGAHTKVFINAGGFSNQVSANEFPDIPISVNVGDRIVVSGMPEIHTATFPRKSFKTTPFVMPACELPGADTPAQSPADCANPSQFELVLNAKALAPTNANKLKDPTKYVNSGLLVIPQSATFVAAVPGRYTFVCLVHGPEMSGVIKVR